MKRQTKKQWCKDWIESFGCDDERVIHFFYLHIGGNGQRPNMCDPEVVKMMVKETLNFKKLIDPSLWKCKSPSLPL